PRGDPRSEGHDGAHRTARRERRGDEHLPNRLPRRRTLSPSRARYLTPRPARANRPVTRGRERLSCRGDARVIQRGGKVMARSELATPRFFRAALGRALLLATLAVVGVTALASGHHFCAVAQTTDAPPKAPPPTRTDNATDVYHGVEVVDSYRWLEDQNTTETRAWIEAQNAYTDSLLAATPGREQLKQRLTALLKVDSINLPRERNGRYFFTKRLANQDQPVLYMRKGLHGTDEVLIDPHPLSPDYTITVQLRSISRDGTAVVYGLRQGGEDETKLRLFDVDGRKDLPDRLPQAGYFSTSLAPDKSAIYYCRMTPAGARVFWHKVGDDVAQDVEVFGKGYGPEKIIVSELSEDGRYLLVHVLYGSAADRTEVHVQNLAQHGPMVA